MQSFKLAHASRQARDRRHGGEAAKQTAKAYRITLLNSSSSDRATVKINRTLRDVADPGLESMSWTMPIAKRAFYRRAWSRIAASSPYSHLPSPRTMITLTVVSIARRSILADVTSGSTRGVNRSVKVAAVRGGQLIMQIISSPFGQDGQMLRFLCTVSTVYRTDALTR